MDTLLKSRDDKFTKLVERAADRNMMRLDNIHKELQAKNKFIEDQLEEDRKQNLDRERFFAFKKDTESLQKHIQAVETKMLEYNQEYDDTLSDFKKNIIEFNKRVTEVSKNLSNITKEHDDLSNAAQMASSAQELLNTCSLKLNMTDNDIKKIHKILETKIDSDEFYKLVQKKMDRQEVTYTHITI